MLLLWRREVLFAVFDIRWVCQLWENANRELWVGRNLYSEVLVQRVLHMSRRCQEM
ncbi:hypothetical protein KC19_8G038500 [Ceratodon purpureus]|uniref:Uncharacterized protein n=1 Tax=Ceratodon purpureus TaxID=3225 RepID=A0A8T0GZ98_CERPU|nr:hypothetical protein KC19_8G038500 [Ceratodon purpureus]